MRRLGILEIFLIQFIFYIILWLWNDYIATLVSVVFTAISFFILIIALLSELIEPSKFPRWYYALMFVSIIAPVVATLIFVGIMGADFNWIR